MVTAFANPEHRKKLFKVLYAEQTLHHYIVCFFRHSACFGALFVSCYSINEKAEERLVLVCSPFFVFKSLRCSMTQAERELLHEYALKFNDADVTRENKDVLIEGSVMMACC